MHAVSTLWVGEHVVMVDRPASRYPYSDDGTISVPAQADWLDPMITLSFAAAASSRIGIATGVLLLPEHNPVVVAKQAASLDRLSGGRLTLGVGVGWSREEFAALGVPFAGRGARTAEYVAAIRTLWRDDIASFDGETVSVALRGPSVRELGTLDEMGIDELVLVEAPPEQPRAAAEWVSALASEWMAPAWTRK